MKALDRIVESPKLPEAFLRVGIRWLVRGRLQQERQADPGEGEARVNRFLERTRNHQIAEFPELANLQHYELPTEFFERILGPRMKYSCCWFETTQSSLAEAEEAMLALTAERAELANGQRILDLGCGWGSLALWAAERHPQARILAVSNSESQGVRIRELARRRGLSNLEHLKADVNEWIPTGPFDRIVSVEMLEHVRDVPRLMGRLRRALAPGGKLFVHVFCHRELAYPFENEGAGDWMARHFFTGGVMPSSDLLPQLTRGAFSEEARWWIPGTHYSRTAAAWRGRLDEHRSEIEALFAGNGSASEGRRSWARWRVFLLACEELFGFRQGSEWGVVHHRFRPVELAGHSG